MTDKRTILVVDDIPLMRAILSKYVRGIGLKVLGEEMGVGSVEIVEAANGKVALERLRESPVDLIFLDLMMPEMDGLTFLERKAEEPALSGIPVIVCSALGERETVDKARALGAAGFIVKPFTLKAVEERFREAILPTQRA